MPVALISTSTSPSRGPPSSTSSMVSGWPAFQATAALVFMRCSFQVSGATVDVRAEATVGGTFRIPAWTGIRKTSFISSRLDLARLHVLRQDHVHVQHFEVALAV